MDRLMLRKLIGPFLTIGLCSSLQASQETIGLAGIHSDGLNLNAMGVSIGQVELERPGKSGYDTEANCCNDKVVPTGVFVLDMQAPMNDAYSDHPLWVASVMISQQTAVVAQDRSPPIGVAQQASLYSSAYLTDPEASDLKLQQDAAVAAQQLAKHLAEDDPMGPIEIPVINMSFGIPLVSGATLNGNSILTQFIDWSAREHDVLYVVAGNEFNIQGISAVPTDNYNGITVTSSRKTDDGIYRRVGIDSEFGIDYDPVGGRTATDLIAPGDMIDAAGPNGGQPFRFQSTGTSMAAPHVTGTVALLQQFAGQQMAGNANAKRHEVMKSVLMNSADKFKGILGMERTVLQKDGTSKWSNTGVQPLDDEMGTGALNANRAFRQFSTGEFGPGSVPLIGWDYGGIDDPDTPQKYVFNQQFSQNSYVSATVVWDRVVVSDFQLPPFDEYKPGEQFIDNGFVNVDLYLMPAGATSTSNFVLRSISTAFNVEHIFGKVPTTGNYELWVVLNDQTPFASTSFALSWWAEGMVTPASRGDFNGDGAVNDNDYSIWRAAFGTANANADANGDGIVDAADYVIWRSNLGLQYGGGSALPATVPEPTALMLVGVLTATFAARRKMKTMREIDAASY